MRSYKRILPILLVAALVGSVYYSLQNKMKIQEQFNHALESARTYADKEIKKDALEQYQVALNLKPSFELSAEAGEVYITYDDMYGAEDWYEDELLPKYPKNPGTYLYGMRVYAWREDFRNFFAAYTAYQKFGLHSEQVEALARENWYAYDLSGIYEDVAVFSNSPTVAAVKYGGKWGYTNQTGKRTVTYRFEQAGLMGEYAPVIDLKGQAACIDAAGDEKINENFILEQDPEFGTVTKFKNIYDGLLLAYNGEKWNFYAQDGFAKQFGGYADALPIANGIGAVSQDGNTWAIISKQGELLTDYVYDEILSDGKEIVCRNDVLLVRQGTAYFLVNSAGQRVGEANYTEARAFNDTTLAAVKKGERWVFVDQTGEEYDFGDFEDAQSFSNGLAAVKIDGTWGFIDSDGKLVIGNEFYDAKPFGIGGACFVKTSSDFWQMLQLYQEQR